MGGVLPVDSRVVDQDVAPTNNIFTCSKAAMTCFSSVTSTPFPKASPGKSIIQGIHYIVDDCIVHDVVSSTLAPSSRKRSAIALPIPCIAPVTKTLLGSLARLTGFEPDFGNQRQG